MLLVVVYLALNMVVVVVGLEHVVTSPVLVSDWRSALSTNYSSPWVMVGIALLVFPKLALGLSGFETGVAVMPQVAGHPDDTEDRPTGRIRGTRRLLTTAAVIMSVFLITSSIITTVLIPQSEFQPGGQANGRALAYLAHEYLGNAFGSVYDISTIILCSPARRPIPIFYFEWTEGNPVSNLLRFLFFGVSEIAPITRGVLRRAEPDRARRPRVLVG